MKLLGITKKLDIVTDDWQSSMEDGLTEYPLYRSDYISGIRNIFQEAAAQSAALGKGEGLKIAGEKRNILSFIGKRGTGKTTAMDEFCRILKSLEKEGIKHRWMELALEEEEERSRLWEKRFQFKILTPIDASLLEEKEDLFELILVNIYREYEEKLKRTDGMPDRYRVREITELFTDILRMYDNVREKKRREETGSYIMDILGFMAGSFDIQARLAELIEELFLLEDAKCDFSYLVVAIDDLDLNLRHGYEMLEQLQKYFSYFRIIILVTMDYTQMSMVCEEHFCGEMKYTIGRPLKEYASGGKALANDCMTKIFHFSQRMYLPNAKKLMKKSEIRFQEGIKE